jgi:hypothetical protein
MAIASAIERGSQIFVYDERGMMLFAKPRGAGPNHGLLGFTSSFRRCEVWLDCHHLRANRPNDLYQARMIDDTTLLSRPV